MMPNTSSGSPIHCRSQSSTTCSSSVAAGDVFQSMALAFSEAESSSAMMPGPGAVFAKYAMNPGWFQCVMAGTIRLRKSSRSEHGVGIQRSREQLRDDAGPRRGVREVRHESGMVPVRDGRHDQAAEILPI